jgi:hypothetical protein
MISSSNPSEELVCAETGRANTADANIAVPTLNTTFTLDESNFPDMIFPPDKTDSTGRLSDRARSPDARETFPAQWPSTTIWWRKDTTISADWVSWKAAKIVANRRYSATFARAVLRKHVNRNGIQQHLLRLSI